MSLAGNNQSNIAAKSVRGNLIVDGKLTVKQGLQIGGVSAGPDKVLRSDQNGNFTAQTLDADSEWIEYTPTLGGGATRATTHTEKALYKVDGLTLHISYFYSHSSATGAAAGTGAYVWSLPTLTPDLAYAVQDGSVVGAASGQSDAESYVGVMIKVVGTASVQMNLGVGTAVKTAGGDAGSLIPIDGTAVYYSFNCAIPLTTA